MHRQLLNQLRRASGLADSAQVEAVLTELRILAQHPQLSAGAAGLVGHLDDFLARVSISYEQHDRDAQLYARSLAISSDELVVAYEKLERDMRVQRSAFAFLNNSVNELLDDDEAPTIGGDAAALDELASVVAMLVRERSSAQRELEMHKFAIDQHAIVSIADLQGKILYVNDQFCLCSGYSRAELIGKSFTRLHSCLHSRDFFREVSATLRRGRVWRGEMRCRRKNGELYWVAATLVPRLGDSDEPDRYISICNDITGRKDTEAALEESRLFLQGITDTLQDGVFRLDEDGLPVFLNPEAERLLGVTLRDFDDARVRQTVAVCDACGRAIAGAEFLMAVTTDRPLHSEDYQMRRADGTCFPISLTVARLQRPGHLAGWVGSFRDLSRRERLQ